ncbi:nucleoside hydrolase [Goodfellowiella coeruleoviolacea]|uniref:Purine nucleosidase n=1 Tax=Goodfellowiella coeruleoviolacea TaxID=334858 RepID=A0AAE3KG62_9PSEU|nr:nucleoside hydrolase [Goodfellowiella coeruleoviolacea]MCP2165139.1 purine nucleosidase [Goodfellowiella coeruleoviolacea]
MTAQTQRRRLVVDTDPGVDDAVALLYLVDQPEVEIVAVGTVHGNVPSATGADNALRILEAAGLPHVPVAVGANLPLNQEELLTGQFIHGENGLSGHTGPAPQGRPVAESAAEQLVRLARQHPGELSVLALGPLTNIALALLLEPRLPELVGEVVWMGGAIDVPGNVTAHADANTWHDAEAAELVLAAGFALTVVPLDVTAHAWVGSDWLDALANHSGPRAQFAHQVLAQYVHVYSQLMGGARGERGCLLHDPVAAVILLEPSLARYEEHQVVVELAGTRTRGATLVDRRGFHTPADPADARKPVRVAVAADMPAVLTRIQHALMPSA